MCVPMLENNTTIVVSGCRPFVRMLKLRYISTHTRLDIHTRLHSSEQLHILSVHNHQHVQPDTLSLVA